MLLNTISRKIANSAAKNMKYAVANAKNIVLQYQDLKNQKNLAETIEQAYGPKGLGILFVNGVPDYYEARKATLPQISKLGNLPREILKKYQRPEIYHSLGWSCGVQQYQGSYDDAKGSYYVNCCSDTPSPIKEDQKHLYSKQELICQASNKWVQQLPQLQKNIKFLSGLMIKTGGLLAKQIDKVVKKNIPSYQNDHLYRVISQGKNHIGRMLHYFPFTQKGSQQGDWCGWHNDHGSLTGLTSAMYLDQNGKQVQLTTTDGGLFAKNRLAQMARIAIPKNMVAFQLGQSAQIHTGGFFQATPHCVIRSNEIAGKKISRDTFALFMQPNPLQIMKCPEGIAYEAVASRQAYKIPQLKSRWQNGMYFKDFHHTTIKHYS